MFMSKFTILWYYSFRNEDGRKLNILLLERTFFHRSQQVLLVANVDTFVRNIIHLHLTTGNTQNKKGLGFSFRVPAICGLSRHRRT